MAWVLIGAHRSRRDGPGVELLRPRALGAPRPPTGHCRHRTSAERRAAQDSRAHTPTAERSRMTLPARRSGHRTRRRTNPPDRVPRGAAPDARPRRGSVLHRRRRGRRPVRRGDPRPARCPVGSPSWPTTPTTPLFFGRLDIDETTTTRPAIHIGRRHVTDDAGEPMVLDWRAPMSRTFYQASVKDPQGVAVRRRFGFVKGELTSFEDEHLDRGEELGTEPHPHRRDRTPPRRADARHRRHHPARAGRAGPRRARRLDLRAGRARHREDRGRAAPRRVSALSAPGTAAPFGRADRRAEHARSCRTSRRCCRRSARSRSSSPRWTI